MFTPVLVAAFVLLPSVSLEATGERVTLDLEVDPLAYALDGYSVHAGVRVQRLRFDLGAFGLTVPKLFATNPDLDERYDGYGVKIDYRLADGRWVPFVGVSGSRVLLRLTEERSGLALAEWRASFAVRTGLEIDIVAGFYLTPWVSLGYELPSSRLTLGREVYERSPWRIFPTVHLGWHPE